MMLLTATTELLEMVTSSTSQVEWSTSWVDMTTSAFTPGSAQGKVSTATTTTAVAAPDASTQRQVKHITVVNVGSTTNQVTLQRDASATDYIVFRVSLLPGEAIHYTDGQGFVVFDAAGRQKKSPSETSGYSGQIFSFFKPGTASDTIGYWYCYSKDAGFPGAWAPGTPGLAGRATDGTTAADAGCIPIRNPATGANYLTNVSITSTVAHWFMLVDVLWVNSGIAVTTTTAQTINSVAFPARCSDGTANGEGLMIGLLTTTANTNAAVINNSTVSYTNELGTAGRTATLANLVGAQIPATPVIGTIVWFMLAAGDKGVRSIQSITLATSLGAGAVSLLVARPIWSQPVLVANVGAHPLPPQNPGIRLYDGTCALLVHQASATTATTASGTLCVMER